MGVMCRVSVRSGPVDCRSIWPLAELQTEQSAVHHRLDQVFWREDADLSKSPEQYFLSHHAHDMRISDVGGLL